jgi:hypothetical protein
MELLVISKRRTPWGALLVTFAMIVQIVPAYTYAYTLGFGSTRPV